MGEKYVWLKVQDLIFRGKDCKMLTMKDVTKLLTIEKIE